MQKAARKNRHIHDVEQLEQLLPFVTSECSSGRDGCELASGVNIFHVERWVKIVPVEQPVKSYSVGAGYMCFIVGLRLL